MAEAAYYDLMVLLDPEAPEERRAGLVDQIKRQIDSGDATLKGDADWGMRRLSYEIDHRREAQYHLFQFQAAPAVLSQLDRSLSIDDGVLRHRIIKLPGEPPATTPRPSEDLPRRTSEERDERSEAPESAAPEAVEAPEAAEGAPAAEAALEPPAPAAPETPPEPPAPAAAEEPASEPPPAAAATSEAPPAPEEEPA
jgi:small subunit ribosomal protein S6